MRITRRTLYGGAAALAFGGVLIAIGFAQERPGLVGPAGPQGPLNDELMVAGPLGEEAQGKADAPITLIEYASMTCPHCANFDINVYPVLKSRDIDTGKVRYILREFPLDKLAAAGSMLARCAGDNKYFGMVDTLFRQQRDWIVQKPLPPLLEIAKQAGFTKESFDACLSNQKLLDGIDWVRQRAAEKFGVNSTPTFIINGKIYRGEMTVEEMEKVFQADLNG